MKHIACVFTFAAALAAQQPAPAGQDPQQELAVVIAVEEQERDLGKAEKLYRDAIAGGTLSAQGKLLAQGRLARLLKKLGREKEAEEVLRAVKGDVVSLDDVTDTLQGQDVERVKALREKARELVQKVLTQQGPAVGYGIVHEFAPGIYDRQLTEQLLWLGEAAVAEIAGALTAELPRLPGEQPMLPPRKGAIAGLAGILWSVGSETAAAQIGTLARDGKPEFRAELYRQASNFREGRMARLVVRLAQEEADEELVVQLLTSGNSVWSRLDTDGLVDLMAKKGPRVRTVLLPNLGSDSIKLRPETLAKVHGVVRQALESSDPELGRAAQQFLISKNSQSSVEGLELLVQELPQIRLQQQWPQTPPWPVEWQRPDDKDRMDPAAAAKFWPKLVACARALDRQSQHFHWLLQRMYRCALELDAAIVPDVLGLLPVIPFVPGGNSFGLLQEKVTLANAAVVFAVYDKLPDQASRGALLEVLGRVEQLPTELYEPLVQLAAAWERSEANMEGLFVRLLAKTGHPDAAARVLLRWRANKKERADSSWLLISLGRRTQAEAVRAAMREMAADDSLPVQTRSLLVLALLSMDDGPALDLVVANSRWLTTARHPYARQQPHPSSPGLTPLQYLLYQNPDPPHGFTEDDVFGVLRRILTPDTYAPEDAEYRRFGPSAMSDRVLGEFARLCLLQVPRSTDERHGQREWVRLVLERSRTDPERKGPLRDWVSQMLQHGGQLAKQYVLEQLEPAEVKAERARIESFVEGEEEVVARVAVVALRDADLAIDPARLVKNRHANVRSFVVECVAERRLPGQEALVVPLLRDEDRNVRLEAAMCLGALVSKEAVPGLIELLRDEDDVVRKVAADSLTRIRFYHEQQAHWDRVLKGLDASPASAAEKLLLQAKPGAPKAQRLLAITSLGTLGVPEALPFLIEWTQDADAEVAAAAKAAVTQIHLNPRR